MCAPSYVLLECLEWTNVLVPPSFRCRYEESRCEFEGSIDALSDARGRLSRWLEVHVWPVDPVLFLLLQLLIFGLAWFRSAIERGDLIPLMKRRIRKEVGGGRNITEIEIGRNFLAKATKDQHILRYHLLPQI